MVKWFGPDKAPEPELTTVFTDGADSEGGKGIRDNLSFGAVNLRHEARGDFQGHHRSGDGCAKRAQAGTLDKDFGELAVLDGRPHCGIVRLVGIKAEAQAAICRSAIVSGP